MANDLTIFNFENMDIRVVLINNEPWFVLNDVCKILGINNSRQSASYLDDEKGITISDTLGGKQQTTIINESGLYSLILRSRKPEAKRFKKWVTSKVLPSIRKTGSYAVSQQFNIPQTLPEALRLAADQAETINRQETHSNINIF